MKKNKKVLKKSEYLSDKKSWAFFLLQMSFLFFSFVLILWGQKKLKNFNQKSAPAGERKAKFIVPEKELQEKKTAKKTL